VQDIRKASVAEFVGTFALIFFGAGSTILRASGELDLVGVALAHGLIVAVMVSQMAHLSGGVFNPGIQLVLWLTGTASTFRSLALVTAQLLGAVAGGWALRALVPGQAFHAAAGGVPSVAGGLTVGNAIVFEAAGTFFLVWAYFATLVDDRGPFGKIAGLPIGLTVTFGILAIGPWTGGAFNVARWLGPALAAGRWEDSSVWIVGPLAGAILSGELYWAVFLRGRQPVTP
jgi:MIP family channel proteins